MKIKSATFHTSAPNLKFCPESEWREFAFIGRSNVGKSSLINMLAGQKNLALVSATPGKTKLINFFVMNEAWCLVDLPGYGYAHVAKSKRVDFNESTADYLTERENLDLIFILIDSRLEPQAIDLDFLQWVQDRSLPFAIVFTKTDKLSALKVQANVDVFLAKFPTWSKDQPVIIQSSAKEQKGKQAILGLIDAELNSVRDSE